MDKKIICLDIGGTKILGCVFDENNNIICKIKKKTKSELGVQKIEEKIISIIEELMLASNLNINDIIAISAGATGLVDHQNGIIIYSPNMPWVNYNFKKVIKDKFKIPVFLENDVNLGVLGENRFGCANKPNVLGIFVGTGIGGGIIIDNKLYRGAKSAAGEIGHMVLNIEGPYCSCGQRGCLESYAGKIAMTNEIKNQIKRGRKTILKKYVDDDIIIKSKALRIGLEQDDELCKDLVEKMIYHLSAGAGNLINAINPDILIFGGGVIEAIGDIIFPELKRNISKFAIPIIYENTEILLSELGDNAILYGALAYFKEVQNNF